MVEKMNRVEFIEKLRIALSGNVNSNKVEENVRFYNDYIDMEVKKGKSETQILDQIGDPRLIAKTIIEANKVAGNGSEEKEPIYDEYERRSDDTSKRRFIFPRLNALLTIAVVIMAVLLFISLFTTVISFLAPVLLPVFLFFLIYRIFQSFWR